MPFVNLLKVEKNVGRGRIIVTLLAVRRQRLGIFNVLSKFRALSMDSRTIFISLKPHSDLIVV